MRWLVVSLVMLASCASGATDDGDGVIKRSDARTDSPGAGDDTATEEDTSTPVSDSTTSDTGTIDTGTIDTAPEDTGPVKCSGEEPEPNNTEATARKLGTIDDCDGSGKTVSGVLSTIADVDVVTFDGTDSFGCAVDPFVTVTGPIRVCMKVQCKSGTTEFKGCPKGTASGSECCGIADVQVDVNCTGTTSEDTKVTMTVRGEGTTLTCAAYTLKYHY